MSGLFLKTTVDRDLGKDAFTECVLHLPLMEKEEVGQTQFTGNWARVMISNYVDCQNSVHKTWCQAWQHGCKCNRKRAE